MNSVYAFGCNMGEELRKSISNDTDEETKRGI